MIRDVPNGDGKNWENDVRRIFLRDNKKNNYYYYCLLDENIQRLGLFVKMVFYVKPDLKNKWYYQFENNNNIINVNSDEILYYIYASAP
jgi:hypothetical protein